jgi:ribosomal-protein-alanine N-acetyltransferase
MMGNNWINIRSMGLSDLEQVQAIDQASFSMPWPASAYQYELTQNPASMLWVAETDESIEKKKVVGMIIVWRILDEAHIATIAVHPDYRRQGIGKILLRFALDWAARNGAQRAMLEVRASNQSAQALYLQFGFEVVSRRPRYYKDNHEDALLMNLDSLK